MKAYLTALVASRLAGGCMLVPKAGVSDGSWQLRGFEKVKIEAQETEN